MKTNYPGKIVDATPVGFLTRKEDFNEYQLEDGKVLKIKLGVTQVARIEGEKDPLGNPVYNVVSMNVVAPLE